MRWFLGPLLATLPLLGCAGTLEPDPSSISLGRSSSGQIVRPARLPEQGKAWIVPQRWRDRGFAFAVDELVRAIKAAAWRVHERNPEARLGVADLSPDGGGISRWHRSHQSGRDADLLFYTTDPEGEPLPPPEHDMIAFDAEGMPVAPPPESEPYEDPDWTERRFDSRRNWQLVASLLVEPDVRVQWVFVADPLKARMLEYADRIGVPRWLRRYADRVMWQPGDSHPHDDHFHVRIYCSRSDRMRGCDDTGPIWRHEKKTYKYGGPEDYDPVRWRLALLPMPWAIR